MANQNPLATSSKAAGGAVVRDSVAETLLEGIFRNSGFLSQLQTAGSVRRVASKNTVFPLYKGRPVAYVVDENAAISTTGAEVDDYTITAKKFATITSITNEMLEDQNTGEDILSLLSADVDSALSDLMEAHALGLNAGANLTSSFDFDVRGDVTDNSVTLGTSGDKLRLAVSDAIAKIRLDGYNPTGVVWTVDAEQNIRDARNTVETTQPVYTDLSSANYGLNVSVSNHLNALSSTSKIVGIVGDFRQAQMVVRSDVRLASTDAGVVGGEEAFAKDKQFYRWTVRAGLGCAFPKAFAVIKTPAGA